jgi:hypothetical protein
MQHKETRKIATKKERTACDASLIDSTFRSSAMTTYPHLPVYQPVCRRGRLPVYRPVYRRGRLPVCLPVCPRGHQPVYLPACQLGRLPAYPQAPRKASWALLKA